MKSPSSYLLIPKVLLKSAWFIITFPLKFAAYRDSPINTSMRNLLEKERELRDTTAPDRRYRKIEDNGAFSKGLESEPLAISWEATEKELTERFGKSPNERIELLGTRFRFFMTFDHEYLWPHYGEKKVNRFHLSSENLTDSEIGSKHEEVALELVDILGLPTQDESVSRRDMFRSWERKGYTVIHSIKSVRESPNWFESIEIRRIPSALTDTTKMASARKESPNKSAQVNPCNPPENPRIT